MVKIPKNWSKIPPESTVNGSWLTCDDFGRQHTDTNIPSYYNPKTGFTTWMSHAQSHKMDGADCKDGDRLKSWCINNSKVHGRLLLW